MPFDSTYPVLPISIVEENGVLVVRTILPMEFRVGNLKIITDNKIEMEASDINPNKLTKAPYRAYKDRKPHIYHKKSSKCGCH